MSTSESTSTSLVERVQDFVSENKRAILLGTAAAVAVGGVVYCASTSSRSRDDIERAEKKDRKKHSKKKKGVNDPDGPILEERKPKVETEEGASWFTSLQKLRSFPARAGDIHCRADCCHAHRGKFSLLEHAIHLCSTFNVMHRNALELQDSSKQKATTRIKRVNSPTLQSSIPVPLK